MFDKVLKPNVTQEQVYAAAAKSIVKGKAFVLQKGVVSDMLKTFCFWSNCICIILKTFPATF